MTALAALGIGSSLLGGILGSSSANKQAKAQQQAADRDREAVQRSRLVGLAQAAQAQFGPQGAIDWIRANLPTEDQERLLGRSARSESFTDQQRSRLAEIDRQLNLPTSDRTRAAGIYGRASGSGSSVSTDTRRRLEQERADLMAAAGGDAGATGLLGSAFGKGTGTGLVGQLEGLATEYGGRGETQLREFDGATNQINQQAIGLELDAARYGEQEARRIKRDAGTRLTSLNRAADATAIGRGFGNSTVLTGQQGQNARNVGEMEEDALGNLSDRQIGLRLNLGSNRLNLANSRNTQRTALGTAIDDRTIGLRMQPINTRLNFATGGITNPDAGRALPSSGTSANGVGLGTFANSLSSLGGFATLAGLSGYGSGGEDPNAAMRKWKGDDL